VPVEEQGAKGWEAMSDKDARCATKNAKFSIVSVHYSDIHFDKNEIE
jgi:hypothetical protein